MNILLLTVPHSATTSTRIALENAKYGTALTSHHPTREGDNLYYDHVYKSSHPYIRRLILEGAKPFLVLRDPLATFGTHWQGGWSTAGKVEHISKRERLVPLYETQNLIAEEFDCKVFPIERTELQEIGDWVGAQLEPSNLNSKGDYPLKQAIKDQDEEAIETLIGEDWQWFKETLTPIFSSLYKQHGYDLWWDNG